MLKEVEKVHVNDKERVSGRVVNKSMGSWLRFPLSIDPHNTNSLF